MAGLLRSPVAWGTGKTVPISGPGPMSHLVESPMPFSLKLPRPLDVTSSVLASQARLWKGTVSFKPRTAQPEKLPEIYDYEGSPNCATLREGLTELDLDVMIYPCPQKGTRFRPRVKELGGKVQFPFMVDPNTGRQMYESADIVDYLSQTYATGRYKAARGLAHQMTVVVNLAGTLARGLRGLYPEPSRMPEKPLELYSFEASPYSRLVRERLCELEIPYILRNTPKARMEDLGPPIVRKTFFPTVPIEGRNRLALKERTGKVQVPYLIDPNTGAEMYESARIIAYLDATYGAKAA